MSRDCAAFVIGTAIGLALVFGGGPARADVIAIGADGAVTVRAGSGAVRWSGDGGAEAVESAPAMARAALSPATMARVPAAYAPALSRAAAVNDLSPDLLAALVWQESGWHAAAVSRAGAVGLTQLMPETARAMGVDPRDPRANLAGGAHYLRQQLDLFDGDIEKALAAYNAGPARVARAGGVPAIAETRSYVSAIVHRLATALGDQP